MNPETAILKASSITKRYQMKGAGLASRGAILTAVDNVDIEIRPGETLGIAGESGCGKSTLARIMAGLLKPENGTICCNGRDIATLPPPEYGEFRRQTQMIFQDPFSSLNPRMRVGDIISEPLILSGMLSSSERRRRTESIMQTVGLSTEHYQRFPHEFSGGQRQRIGIARALAAAPSLIIADEPVSALDISIQAQIINLLISMKQQYKLSMLIVSHDLSVLRHVCDRICIMYLGKIVETAPAAEIFESCRHPYTEALIEAIPRLNRQAGPKRLLLKDDIPSPLAIPSGCRFHPRCSYARDICRTSEPQLEPKQAAHMTACHFSELLTKP